MPAIAAGHFQSLDHFIQDDTEMTFEPGSSGGMHLASDLWLDQDNAGAEISARLSNGELEPEQADQLRFFSEHGYLIFDPGLDDALIEDVQKSVDHVWKTKPADLAYAMDSPAKPMSVADESRDRRTRYRIHDLQSHSESALALYLNPEIFRLMRLILGLEAIAIQSLYFEYGSEQMLHRDPVLVPTGAAGHLAAAWIALEDIHPDSGPLVYYPGSHKLPYYEFAPGQFMFNSATMGKSEIEAGFEFDETQCRKNGLTPRKLTARKGEVFIWHASLRHGGAEVLRPEMTRNSFVVHFSTIHTYPARAITICPDPNSSKSTIMETDRIIKNGNYAGFDNPMRGRAR